MFVKFLAHYLLLTDRSVTKVDVQYQKCVALGTGWKSIQTEPFHQAEPSYSQNVISGSYLEKAYD